MTRQELICLCLTFPETYEDYPFDDIIDARAWTVIRHKMHWNTVTLDGDVPDEEIKRLISQSYDLIKPKVKRRESRSQSCKSL